MFWVTLLLGLITFLLLGLHWFQTRSNFALLYNKFPMVRPYKPLIGHVSEFSSKPEILFPQLRVLISKFKETFGTWSAHLGVLHVFTPDDAEIILSNMNYNTKGIVYDFIKPWLGDGLLISDERKWQHRRKLLTPTFHFNILRRFVEVFGEHSNNLVQELKANKDEEINLIPVITHGTLASICETAMGTKLDMNDKRHTKYLDALYAITPTIINRALIPPYYLSLLFALSPLGFFQRGFIKILHKFTTNIIKEREENFIESDVLNLDNNNADEDVGIKKKRLAMLDLLISAKKRNEIDFEGIREEVDTFMFEGHDTTAIGIVMALMLLAHHEEIQDKIIKELDEIFEDDDRPASYEDLMKMKYLELCIKESLRLYPSVPLITRKPKKDVQLTHNKAPAGCEILIHIFDLHRNEEIFPDPEKFDPNRFLPENCKGRHPYAYIPFSAGPRNCIGQKYALLEMKSIISSMLRNFKLEPVTKFEEIGWAVDLVLRPTHPLNIKIVPRE